MKIINGLISYGWAWYASQNLRNRNSRCWWETGKADEMLNSSLLGASELQRENISRKGTLLSDIPRLTWQGWIIDDAHPLQLYCFRICLNRHEIWSPDCRRKQISQKMDFTRFIIFLCYPYYGLNTDIKLEISFLHCSMLRNCSSYLPCELIQFNPVPELSEESAASKGKVLPLP